MLNDIRENDIIDFEVKGPNTMAPHICDRIVVELEYFMKIYTEENKPPVEELN